MELSFGVDAIRPIEIPAEDRNRTSPFPYGGARFEFRAVGSSQNVSLVNTVLATITADSFKEIADRVEKGEKALDVARALLKTHFRVIFNGNGYDKEWPAQADARGIWRINSGVEAIQRFTQPKNVALFGTHKVFTAEECDARQDVLLGHYTGTVETEALVMIDMINQHVLPSLKAADMLAEHKAVEAQCKKVHDALHAIHGLDAAAAATASRVLRLETMIEARKVIDSAEGMCPEHLWTLATYKSLLFLDSHDNGWVA
jgi:glutamine synthetase